MAPENASIRRSSAMLISQHRKSIQSFSEEFNAVQAVNWAVQAFGDGLVLQTSAGIQAAVMLKLVTSIKPDVKVVFVDTGYLPAETTRYMETLRQEFNLNLTIARPQLTSEEIETKYGKLWDTDHELYGEITKVEPMNRALKDLGCVAILSGLRAQQTSNREALKKLSFELESERYKVLPILDWTKEEVKAYMKDLPKHPLEAAGFATIGDKHSSRALKAGETNERATRFGGKSQECGLHTSTSSLADIMAQLEETALPDGFVVFTKPACKFCKAAKALLKQSGKAFIEKDVTQEATHAEMLQNAPAAKTVPQIFEDNCHIGGFTELFSCLGIQGTVEEFVAPFAEKKPVQAKTAEPKTWHRKTKTAEPKMWHRILRAVSGEVKINPTKYYAEAVLGGAALLSLAGVIAPVMLQKSPGALTSGADLLDSTARLISDSRILDRSRS
jgi:phosphoadenosine phosphosulfate reductase